MSAETPREYVDAHVAEFREDLFELLAQPSVSATGEGVAECTAMVEAACLEYGFDDVEVVPTDGQPAVLARADADPGAVAGGEGGDGGDHDDADPPTLLVYGHYDVQPADPAEWTSPPFEPTVRPGPDGRDRVYARGAGDNKGQFFAHLAAVRALRATTGLPVDVALLVEGEEESGSPNLGEVVREGAGDLDPDLAYVADGPVDQTGRPHVLLGARGMVYVQVDAVGPNRDLHSGNYGGPVPNPAWELVRLAASMKDESGRVAIEGFYDDVRPVGERDREALAAMPFDADAVKADLGVDAFADGPGDSYLETLLYYPTLNIAGFTSGYGGEGTKTILPSRAQLKMDMRLVADQDPADVAEKFRAHVAEHASGTVDLEVTVHGTMAPQRTPLDHPVVEPMLAAVEEGFGEAPVLKPTLGGSLPTAVFADELDVPCVTVPYANEDENNHSPDENLALENFGQGVATSVAVFERLAADDWRER